MPDLINPEATGGKKTYIVWRDELCASCLNQGSCALIQVLHQCIIMTHSGIHVSNCDDYRPDEESEYYLAPDADTEEIMRINLETLQQQVDLLKEKMGNINAIPE